jgi:DNA topoisomerase-1
LKRLCLKKRWNYSNYLELGEFEGMEVSVNIGRFGPYVKFGEQFISLPKGEEPTDVSLERAIEVIKSKQVDDAPLLL